MIDDILPLNNSHCVLNIQGVSDVIDHSGRAHTVTNNGVTNGTPVNPDTADTDSMQFNGTNDYLSVPDSADFDFGAGIFAISFWFKTNSLAANPVMLAQLTDSVRYWKIQLTAANGLQVQFRDDADSISCNEGGVTGWDTTDFHHVAVLADANYIYIAHDGAIICSAARTHTLVNKSGAVWVGNMETKTDWVNGNIQNLQIFKGFNPFGTRDFTPPNRIM